jgi:60 kDa SS-A/Ro ribonucleoprotein
VNIVVNPNVFRTNRYNAPAPANTVNNAGGLAYSLSDKEALAQLVMTGTFNNTFYTSAENQINNVKRLLNKLGPDEAAFIAKLAIHARKQGFMKDTPAYLVAWLSKYGSEIFKTAFEQVIDNGKMLRNFVQIMRSGAVGRRSLGTAPKTMVKNWITRSSVDQLIYASVGNTPSLADIIKMVHPTPINLGQSALFQWILNGKTDSESFGYLPQTIKDLMAFRSGDSKEIPNVPFELLTSCELSTDNWKDIARNAGWHMTRMNLNTFERKGLFNDPEMVYTIADKLQDTRQILKAKVFPYQIFTTWLNATNVPVPIREALEKALDYSLQTVPVFDGKTYIFVDVSGSMTNPITGHRVGSTTKMRCVDVAALIASSLLRTNPTNTQVVMFDTKIYPNKLKSEASVMENAHTIAKFGGGGTAIQLPLQKLVNEKQKGDLIIYVSDNESWFSTKGDRYSYIGRDFGTETAAAWSMFKKSNPGAKMVCIDLTPNTTTQNMNEADVLNVGGFNDAVYGVIQSFLEQGGNANFWTNKIEKSVTLEV